MKRITTQVKAIADAHIKARIKGEFNPCECKTIEDVRQAMMGGHTFEFAMDEIEIRFMPVGTILLARRFDYCSSTYKSAVYRAFKKLFAQVN
jgi:hypothetical protein